MPIKLTFAILLALILSGCQQAYYNTMQKSIDASNAYIDSLNN